MRAKDESKEILILDTALDLIVRTGLSGLKMTDLAKAAGLATGTVYIYFQDKEALIRQIYLYLLKKTTSDLVEGIPAADPLKVKTRKLCFNYLRDQLEHPEYAAFFEQYFRSPFFRETDFEQAAEYSAMQPIYDLVVEGQAAQIIKPLEPSLLVTLVCGMLNELARTAHYENRLVGEAEWHDTFGVIWDGIKS
jgi:AcrR family transcriptional regulator